MKKFIKKVFLLILPIIPFIFLFVFSSNDEELKIKSYSELPSKNNIIFLGDSKPLFGLDYSILKNKFPEYNIVNLSIWAKNPKYVYSVYKEIFKEKKISESIILYNLTFRHILNRTQITYNGISNKTKIKVILKKILGIEYDFNYTKEQNHFILIKDSDFGNFKDGFNFYTGLESNYIDDFQTQLNYIDSLKVFFNQKHNHFITTELPHRQPLDSIYKNLNYYKKYRQTVDSKFPENLYFGYIDSLNNKNYWFNQDHLNMQGAEAFTKILISYISNKTKP